VALGAGVFMGVQAKSGAHLGVSLLNVMGRPSCPYDVSRLTGVKFWAIGAVDTGYLRFTVPTVETHAHVRFLDRRRRILLTNFAPFGRTVRRDQ
jgi:hypothetical protein